MHTSAIGYSKPRLVAAICLIATAIALPFGERAYAGRGSPPQDVATTFLLPASINGCGFDVLVTASGKSGFINLPGGDFLITSPALFATFTNATDSNKTVTLNLTGSGVFSTDQNGNVVVAEHGRNGFFAQGFGTKLLIGDWTLVLDPTSGQPLQAPIGNGQIIDICAMIQ